MSAHSVSEAVQRLGRDPTLRSIYLFIKRLSDSELAELVDCLLAHPDVVTHVYLDGNQLTDETGVKLARYLAASSTVQSLSLWDNQLGAETYLALAAALRVNSSLRVLYLYGNQEVDQTRIDARALCSSSMALSAAAWPAHAARRGSSRLVRRARCWRRSIHRRTGRAGLPTSS